MVRRLGDSNVFPPGASRWEETVWADPEPLLTELGQTPNAMAQQLGSLSPFGIVVAFVLSTSVFEVFSW